jgi:hypothetical protein
MHEPILPKSCMWIATATQVRRAITVLWPNALTAERRFALTVELNA